MWTELKDFFEKHPLALEATKSIKDGREIEIHIKGEETHIYTLTRVKGANVYELKEATKPDMTFIIPKPCAEEIIGTEYGSVAQIGLKIFEKVLTLDECHKIRIKIQTGFLSLLSGGYLGVLTSGGAEITKFLAAKGLSNPGKIKDAISKMKKG